MLTMLSKLKFTVTQWTFLMAMGAIGVLAWLLRSERMERKKAQLNILKTAHAYERAIIDRDLLDLEKKYEKSSQKYIQRLNDARRAWDGALANYNNLLDSTASPGTTGEGGRSNAPAGVSRPSVSRGLVRLLKTSDKTEGKD